MKFPFFPSIQYKILKKTGLAALALFVVLPLTLNLLTTTIVAPPSNASKWQMGFNSAFKGLITEI